MSLKRKKPIHQEPLAICHACGSEAITPEKAKEFEQANNEIEVLNRAVARAADMTERLTDDRNKFLLILAQCAIAQGVVRVDARTVDAILAGGKSPHVMITKEPKLIASPGDLDAVDYVVRVEAEEETPIGVIHHMGKDGREMTKEPDHA